MGIVYGNGINNMERGWASENEWNYRVYRTWQSMIRRCYDKKYHKTCPTYVGCNVCNDWLYLSNFIRDFKLIDGYDEEKFLNGELCLDKDIKSNGQNKEYSVENCMLVSKSENTRQSNKTMDYSFLHNKTEHPMYGKTGENHPRSIKIAQYDKQKHELIKIWNSAHDIKRELGIDSSHIIACCKFWETNCNEEEWFKTHKNKPVKSSGGYIFKYYKEDD